MKELARLSSLLINGASSLGIYIGAIALAAIAVLLVIEVILRYIFSTSTLIADEVAGYLMVALIYFALSDVLRTGRHITITVVVDHLSLRTQRLLGHVVAILLIVLGIILSWQAWVLTVESFRWHSVSPSIIRFPQYIPQMTIAVGLTLFTLQATSGAIRQFRAKVPQS